MVSTDGHRLSKVERTIPNGPKLSAGVIRRHAERIEQRRGGDPGRGEDRKRERPERGADMAQLIGGSPSRLRGASNPASPQRNLPAGGGAADRVCRSFPARRDRSARALY
jgi:hypothetical protein